MIITKLQPIINELICYFSAVSFLSKNAGRFRGTRILRRPALRSVLVVEIIQEIIYHFFRSRTLLLVVSGCILCRFIGKIRVQIEQSL